MTSLDTTVATLFAGVLVFICAGILLPGYAWLLVASRAEAWLATRFPAWRDESSWFPVSGLDAGTFALLFGALWGASTTTALSHLGINLAQSGKLIFAVIALLSAVAIAALRINRNAKIPGTIDSALNSAKEGQQPLRRLEQLTALALLLLLPIKLYLDFYASPIIWDVPDLGLIQRSFWGDFSGPLRGGWIFPGLIMLSGVFEPTRFPLLNAGVGAGWLSAGILMLGIVYLAGRGQRLIFSALFGLFLLDSRFVDFLLNTKFSVLGVALFVLLLGLVRRYLETSLVRYAIAATVVLGLAHGGGDVGVFYSLFALAFLLFVCGSRMLPIAAGALAWFALTSAANALHWSVLLLSIPLAIAASALTVSVSIGWSSEAPRPPKPPRNPSRLMALALIALAACGTALAFRRGYEGYEWYAAHRLLSLYRVGYGPFLLFPIAFLIYALLARPLAVKNAVVLSIGFAAITAPLVDIGAAAFGHLPGSVPSVIYYEIGRVTSLYVAPLAISIAGAAGITTLISSISRRRDLLAPLVLGFSAIAVVIPSAIYPIEGVGGFERVAFRPLLRIWRETRLEVKGSAVREHLSDRSGALAAYPFHLTDFSEHEISLSRDLAELGGPANHCLFFLIRDTHLLNDAPASAFFEWEVSHHLYPYSRMEPSLEALARDSADGCHRTVVLHKADYDLADKLPADLKLKREVANYRIYSELP